ncbi:MAG: hypothetical protein QXF52_07365 [Thermoproteota archaeon]
MAVLAIVILLICILNAVMIMYYSLMYYSRSYWPLELNYQSVEAFAISLVVCDLIWEIYKNLFKQEEKKAKEKQ